MNSKSRTLLLLSTALLIAGAAGAAQPVMSPGRWEITIKTTDRYATSTSVFEVCISPEAAAQVEPLKRKPTDDCQVADGVLKGNRVKYDVQCGAKNKNTKTKADFIYSGDTYEGVVDIKTDDFEVKQVHTARRLGACETQQ